MQAFLVKIVPIRAGNDVTERIRIVVCHHFRIAGGDGSIKALPRRRSQSCCDKSSEARDFVSQQWSGKASCCDGDEATSSLDAFLQQTVENTFTVSGMVFQDAYNLDLDRLRRCYICEVDTDKGMVPFCAYNLTDIHGRALYRK